MASTIASYAVAPEKPRVYDPNNHVSLADQTTTTAVQTAVQVCGWFRALVSLKTFTLGNGTIGATFELQAADNVAFNTNVITVATGLGAITTAVPSSLILEGCSPVTRKQFYRLLVTFNGTGSGTFDCLLDATP